MIIFNAFSIIFVFAFFITTGNSDSCKHTFKTATYDLDLLRISKNSERNYHLIADADITRNYTYYFNFCDKVQHMPLDFCTNATLRPPFAQGYCPSIQPNQSACQKDIVQISTNVYAYQVEESTSHCYRLSKEDGGPMEWELYDENDPSAGIILQMSNGDYSTYCRNANKNRNLALVMRCNPANVGIDLSDVAYIEEDADKEVCSYKMELHSIWGCPTQCGIYNNALCKNHGICSYDFSNDYPKCFCFSNFGGDGCQKGEESSNSAHSADEGSVSYLPNTLLTPLLKHNGTKIQFDWSNITEMKRVIEDNDGSASPLISMKDYKFHFQFEENIDIAKLPSECMDALLPCDYDSDENCIEISESNSIGVAFRIDNRDSSCVLLGVKSLFTTELFDIQRPAKGAVITYTGGYDETTAENFQFRIELECPNMDVDYYERISNKSVTDVTVGKYDEFTYLVNFRTPIACPTICRKYNENGELYICSGRGICVLDPFQKRTKCLCDDGYEGDFCSSKINSNGKNVFESAGFIITIVILCLLLIGVAVFGYMKYRHWKQKAELAYAQFGDSELINDLMTVGPDMEVDDTIGIRDEVL